MKNLDMVKVRLVPDYKLHSEEQIDTPEKAIEILKKELSDFDREAMCILNLNSKGIPINASIVSIGDLSSTVVHPREVFKCAILSSATAVMLMHNHPSGDAIPSDEDIRTTQRMIAGGRFLGIRVIDHFITAPGNKVNSMRNMGLLDMIEKLPFDELDKEINVDLPEGKAEGLSDFGICRMVEGKECSIALTKEEVFKAYMDQQYEFDRDYIMGYLKEIDKDPKESQIFKLKHDLNIKKVLSSEAILQKITSELGRQKNKQQPDDETLMDTVLSKALDDIPRRKPRKHKEER